MKPSRFADLDRFYDRAPATASSARPSLRFEAIGGEEITTEHGPILRLTRHYTWDRLPAAASWEHIRSAGWRPQCVVSHTPAQVTLERVTCLDIETTGLSLGAGTVAFLVGLASACEDGVRVDQYLMRDFTEEAAQQWAVARALGDCELVVTYNGGRFDLPILRSRAVINRMEADWLARPHLDLLHPVRAVWRRSWPDCRLATAECRLLGIVRTADCEGWEVPLRYRQFLNQQSEAPLLDVIEHNVQDVISLICLLAAIQNLFEAPPHSWGLTQAELFGLGHALETRGRTRDAIQVLAEARRMGRLDPGFGHAMRTLVRLLKRAGAWQEARAVWTELTLAPEPFERFWAFAEEAKFAEHTCRDFDLALTACAQAQAAVASLHQEMAGRQLQKELTRREVRLKRRRDARRPTSRSQENPEGVSGVP